MNRERKREEESLTMAKQKLMFMCGYLPGALPQRSPILSPVVVRTSGFPWKDVCGGGCGFAMAISDSGKLITWGSTDDLGQSYVTSGKHGEIPEPFPLPTDVSIMKAAAGWAHCVAATDNGEVYTWGWRECVPSGRVFGDPSSAASIEKGELERQSPFLTEQVSPRSQGSRSTGGSGTLPGVGTKECGDGSTKRRRISSTKQAAESSSSGDETPSALPCLVTLNPGVKIATVAAGGRHTLALSDIGQVWGWGYGGEGQLGLGSRIRMMSSPHPIPCIDHSYAKDRPQEVSRAGRMSDGHGFRVPGSYVKGIACGGRHSAVITDAGALLSFGWGLYGQRIVILFETEILNVLLEEKKLLFVMDMNKFYPLTISSTAALAIFDWKSLTSPSSIKKLSCSSLSHRLNCLFLYPSWTLVRVLKLTVLQDQHVGKVDNGGDKSTVDVEDECGQGSTDDELSPKCVSSLLGIRIEGVAAGLWHTVCISADGDVYVFGGNQFGQLGTGGDQAETIPRLLHAPSLESVNAKIVSCGARHSAIIAEDGKVFCWGWNKYGQLGLGDVIDRNIPCQVTIEDCVAENVACGWWHTLLLAEQPV